MLSFSLSSNYSSGTYPLSNFHQPPGAISWRIQMKAGNDSPCPESGKKNMEGKVWETFQNSFTQVQTILDQNRILIREINQNHESKIPENLTRNVALIRELNTNIAKVVELYAKLSTDFVQSMTDNGEFTEKLENGGESTAKVDRDSSKPAAEVSAQKRPRFG